jgi:hypothetical protein
VRPTLVIALAALLFSCAPSPPPQTQAAPDLTAEAWYTTATTQLAAIAGEAAAHFKAGRFDETAAAITRGQPLQARLLEATRPTLGAMEAASDLDELYGRMLLHNGNVGYARSTFQKNVVRWKVWKPQTPETERRLKAAIDAVAECDRRL